MSEREYPPDELAARRARKAAQPSDDDYVALLNRAMQELIEGQMRLYWGDTVVRLDDPA